MNSRVENEITTRVRRLPLLDKEPQTLAELFLSAVRKAPRKDALNYKKNDEWHSISSVEMLSRIENIALGLFSIGLRKDDKAAILAANSPEWTLCDAGCQFAGIIDVPVYTTLAPEAVSYIIKDSGAKIFFLQDKAAFERLGDTFSEGETAQKFFFFDSTDLAADNAISLTELEPPGAKLKNEQPAS
ncbi:MAG: AMP-binding protein, partial [Pyrinomonadaceae bacterium]